MTTIKEHCCGADSFFDKKTANKKYRSYLKNGPPRVTSKITQQLENQEVTGKSLIDVGGGIGALQWWFLENGGSNTIDIDASSGYLKQAEEHAKSKDWESKSEFLLGDCMAIYPQIANADIITLDKVVCCYPNYKEILEATCNKANIAIALSYPMDGFIAEAIQAIGIFAMRLRSNPFRPYVHSVKDIRTVFADMGYVRVSYNLAFPWHVETYVKNNRFTA